MRKKERAAAVVEALAVEYPDAECELEYRSPWELLVATVLSAQCTDQRVNQVTPSSSNDGRTRQPWPTLAWPTLNR